MPAAPPAREVVRSCARARGGAHGQLPGGEALIGKGKSSAKKGAKKKAKPKK